MPNKGSQMSIETCCFCNVIVFNSPTRNLAKAKGNIDEHCFSDKKMLVDWSALRLVRSTSRARLRKYARISQTVLVPN